jgi:plastocyanin
MTPLGRVLGSAALAAALAGAACKGDAPTDPSTPPCATITIAANVASPKAVTISPGCQVLFVNSDSIRHNMVSDPHPEHTDCPPINSVGSLNPGQERRTGNLNTVGTCGFHDHDLDQVAGLRGTITIR